MQFEPKHQKMCRLNFSWLALTAIFLLALVFIVHPSAMEPNSSGMAWADDDDSGDDDGGDDAGGNDSGGNGGQTSVGNNSNRGSDVARPSVSKSKPKLKAKPKAKPSNTKERKVAKPTTKPQTKQVAKAPRSAPVPQQQVLAANAPREIVAIGLSAIGITELETQGYQIVQRDVVRALELVMVRLRVPQNRTLNEARQDIEALGADADADLNHFYRTQQAPSTGTTPSAEANCTGGHCAAFQQISWPLEGSAPLTCAQNIIIGMVDTGINIEHEAFENQSITLLPASMPGEQKSALQHGTAVAAILVGGQNSRSPGILPSASLFAADVFHRQGNDERADVYAVVKALDMLDQRGVNLINMSLAGPANGVLARMVAKLSNNNSIIVAAAGNGGPNAPPAFPAAYPEVIAVTAIDTDGKIYRRANQGTHIDFAAPGVNIWTAASVKGAKRSTGTSFAAPFVTAAFAAAKTSSPVATPDQLVKQLKSSAIDLGKKGFDPAFGNGLVQAAGFCNSVK